MDSLFAQPQKKPLADRMRPTRLSDFVGQETAVGERSPLRRMIERISCSRCCFTDLRVLVKQLWHRSLPI